MMVDSSDSESDDDDDDTLVVSRQEAEVLYNNPNFYEVKMIKRNYCFWVLKKGF